MTALAPLRDTTSAHSSVLNRVLTGTSTAPAVMIAKAATIHSAELGAHTATRSPLPMPNPANAPAALLEDGNQERADHPDEVADGGGGQLSATVRRVVHQQLARLEAEGLVAVDDALRIAGGAGGERDECWSGGIRVEGARQRHVVEKVVEALLADERNDGHVLGEVRLERHPTELPGRDEGRRLRGREDVRDLLASVEVHDPAAASIQFGNCSATTSPGPTPPLAQTRREPTGHDLDVAE